MSHFSCSWVLILVHMIAVIFSIQLEVMQFQSCRCIKYLNLQNNFGTTLNFIFPQKSTAIIASTFRDHVIFIFFFLLSQISDPVGSMKHKISLSWPLYKKRIQRTDVVYTHIYNMKTL